MTKITLSSLSLLVLLTLASCTQTQSMTNLTPVPTIASASVKQTPVISAPSNGFIAPTEYSRILLNKHPSYVLSQAEKWQEFTNNKLVTTSIPYNVAEDIIESCQTDAINQVIIPLLNKNGFNISSVEEAMQRSYEEKQKLNEFAQNNKHLEDDANTYLVNCMVDKGYRFGDTQP